MLELVAIAVGAALVNNFVLVRFLGLCPVIGAGRRLDAALGMSAATAVVLTTVSVLGYLLERLVLEPFDLQHLRILAFILVIAGTVQLTELLVRRYSQILHQQLGIYLPLITTNCAVLGVALLNAGALRSLAASLAFGLGAGAGFCLVIVLFAAIRERLETADVPGPFRGPAIALITAGMLSLAFLGFAGLQRT